MNPSLILNGLLILSAFKFYDKVFGSDNALGTKNLESAIKTEQSQGQTASFSQTLFLAKADQIYNSLKHSWIADDKDTAERVLLQMQKTIDVLELAKAYGKRQHYLFGVPDGEKQSLFEAVASELSDSRISRINQAYQKKGINIKF